VLHLSVPLNDRHVRRIIKRIPEYEFAATIHALLGGIRIVMTAAWANHVCFPCYFTITIFCAAICLPAFKHRR
jgi:hypothetical protein